MNIGNRVLVKPSEILGTPSTTATVIAVINDMVTGEELYGVWCDDDGPPAHPNEWGVVIDEHGVVCSGPPSNNAEYTRFP
jgi:hypothetical protein